MKRKIIRIDEEKCTGCGLCVPGCHEEAIKIIDGKARLVNDVFCDGLGACLGECPEGALTLEEREADPFDEKLVAETIAGKKRDGVLPHHGQSPSKNLNVMIPAGGCPGSAHAVFERKAPAASGQAQPGDQPSELTHWPIQLHLVNPAADFFRGKDVVLAADCVAFAAGDFHSRFLKGKTLAIACPKLDEGQDEYIEKIRRMADEAKINTLTVVIMQVPCCRGLMQIAQAALQKATRKVPLKAVVVSIQGDVLSEEWL
ncbi:MAG: 4Fe-4S ferredoxin [Deltaproteobacteria bacterium HGW-Deltaproteobacteria-6]|jgi:NAD-dependent dihydropyrimidine dehydrogenase PreA subunit|nr:MAG: 4Fe-4S ferredoxin [Deltaproteobacteria bacterium HGW-Deltaproteobacteria-6]